jgi:hypothetical protein
MVNDDFGALDLLSMGGFKLCSTPFEAPRKKKKKGKRTKNRHQPAIAAKRGLAEILPLIGGKLRRPRKQNGLQGWPVSLSWPTEAEVASVDLWSDHGGQSLS